MKRTTEKMPAANGKARSKNDDLYKYLAEEYPEQFARRLLVGVRYFMVECQLDFRTGWGRADFLLWIVGHVTIGANRRMQYECYYIRSHT